MKKTPFADDVRGDPPLLLGRAAIRVTAHTPARLARLDNYGAIMDHFRLAIDHNS